MKDMKCAVSVLSLILALYAYLPRSAFADPEKGPTPTGSSVDEALDHSKLRDSIQIVELSEYDKQLLIDGADSGIRAPLISVDKIFKYDENTEIALITDSMGGNICPAGYALIVASKDAAYRVYQFGNCSEDPEIEAGPKQLRIAIAENEPGNGQVIEVRNGAVFKNGTKLVPNLVPLPDTKMPTADVLRKYVGKSTRELFNSDELGEGWKTLLGQEWKRVRDGMEMSYGVVEEPGYLVARGNNESNPSHSTILVVRLSDAKLFAGLRVNSQTFRFPSTATAPAPIVKFERSAN